MIIEIKGQEYLNPDIRFESGEIIFRYTSDATFMEIVNQFALEPGDSIKQYNDSHEQIGEWYIIQMGSIKLPGSPDGEAQVIIHYRVSQLGKEAQEALNSNVDEISDAALELAGMIAQFDESLTDKITYVEDTNKSTNRIISALQEQTNSNTYAISDLSNRFNILADRIARLENRG